MSGSGRELVVQYGHLVQVFDLAVGDAAFWLVGEFVRPGQFMGDEDGPAASTMGGLSALWRECALPGTKYATVKWVNTSCPLHKTANAPAPPAPLVGQRTPLIDREFHE